MLNSSAIKKLIEEKGLIQNYVDLEKQLQPCGFDLTLKEVREFSGFGMVDLTNKERTIAPSEPLNSDEEGWFHLPEGSYKIVYNEEVRIPLNIVAMARSRSTMLRNGAVIETALWDPGYNGRSSSLLVVTNPHGIRLKLNARVTQLVFFNIEVTDGYRGEFQNERLD
jgi:dUTP pyrophosphatase